MKTLSNSGHFCFVLCLIFISVLCTKSNAQSISPISSKTFYHAPYMHSISDLMRSSENKIELHLRLLDASINQAKIKLRMVLESDNVRIENHLPLPNTFSIGGGDFLQLNFDDLRRYFELSQLSFSGLSKQSYLQSGERLPDGSYRLFFEVFEAETGRKVSLNENHAFFNLISCDPPILNSPTNNSTILFNSMPSILFSWTPRHLAHSGVFGTEYKFEMIRIPRSFNGDWEKQFKNFPIVYELSTNSCSFLYDQSLPPLEVGYIYAYRVKASVSLLNGSNLIFNNNGYSEVFHFLYKEDCPPIAIWKIDSISPFSASCNWTPAPIDKGYTILYRKSNVANAQWFSSSLPEQSSNHKLYPLEPSTTYECKLNRNCSYAKSENDVVKIFTTPSEDSSYLRCGQHPEVRNILPGEGLEILRMFDQVKTQTGFILSIDEVDGGNGKFSGKAHTYIPLLGNTGVNVRFSNIIVNKNYELVSGEFKAVVSRRKL